MQDIDKAIAETQQRIDQINGEIISLTATAESLDDPRLMEADNQLHLAVKRLQRLAHLKQAGAVRLSADILAQKQAEREQACKAAKKLAKDRIPVAQALDAAFATVGKLLAEWDRLGTECHRNTTDTHRGDALHAWAYSFLNDARGNSERFTGALEFALLKHGIGDVGVYLPGINHRPLGDAYTFAEAAEIVAERLAFRLEESLANPKIAEF